jgi:phospholipid-binding lipoprotein MlaA
MKTSQMLVASVVLLVSGCATVPPDGNVNDPYEHFNRKVFEFNDTVDAIAVKPIAKAYNAVLPSFVQTGITNFFGNIGDSWTMVNDFLQGNVESGVADLARVSLNTIFGLGGIVDFASAANIPRHSEDMGKTLGVWGFPDGPYIVLPLLGPSTVRDTIGTPFDYYGDLWGYTTPVYVRNSGSAVRAVNKRSGLLGATNLLDDAALDKYIFTRDGYLQRRASQVDARIQERQDRIDDAAAAAAVNAVSAVPDEPEK